MIDPIDGLECGACGGVACRPYHSGAYESHAGRCAECGVPGWVDYDADGLPVWWTDESEDA